MSLVGERIGNYVASSLLGSGGMGAVYGAEHPEIGRKVAIKVLARHLLQIPAATERFLAEARAVTRIDHPNIIDIYDFGRLDDGRPYFVMEMLAGTDLMAVMEGAGRMPARKVLQYLEQIGAGLQAAHDHNVVHRDLKPENIFVAEGEKLRVKLLDFGIAKVLETEQGAHATATGMIMGTPLVIAPEQAAGQPKRIGPRTDIYSLGVILYWMLAGRPPFESDTPALLLARHIKEPPPPLRGVELSVPPQIAALVERCLEKMPEDRPSSVEVVVAEFAGVVQESPDDELEESDSTVPDILLPEAVCETEALPRAGGPEHEPAVSAPPEVVVPSPAPPSGGVHDTAPDGGQETLAAGATPDVPAGETLLLRRDGDAPALQANVTQTSPADTSETLVYGRRRRSWPLLVVGLVGFMVVSGGIILAVWFGVTASSEPEAEKAPVHVAAPEEEPDEDEDDPPRAASADSAVVSPTLDSGAAPMDTRLAPDRAQVKAPPPAAPRRRKRRRPRRKKPPRGKRILPKKTLKPPGT